MRFLFIGILLFGLVFARNYEKDAYKMRQKASQRREQVSGCRVFNPFLYKKIQDIFYSGVDAFDKKHYQYSAEIFSDCLYLCDMIEQSEKYTDDIEKAGKQTAIAEEQVRKATVYNGMLYVENQLTEAVHFFNIAQELYQKAVYGFQNGEIKVINRRERFENIAANCEKVNRILGDILPKMEAFHRVDEKVRILEDKIIAYKNTSIMDKEPRKFAMLRDWFDYEKERLKNMKADFYNASVQDLFTMSSKLNEFDFALVRLVNAPEYVGVIEDYDEKRIKKIIDSSSDKMLYVIKKGDTLWSISGKLYNDPEKWREIYKMNKDIIEDPDYIFPEDKIKY